MGTIWTNSRITQQFDKIVNHQNWWFFYILLTPIILITAGFFAYLAEVTKIYLLFWVYVILTGITVASWWAWTMCIFLHIIKLYSSMIGMMYDISEEIKEIKSSISKE
jgi:hypothetical protein